MYLWTDFPLIFHPAETRPFFGGNILLYRPGCTPSLPDVFFHQFAQLTYHFGVLVIKVFTFSRIRFQIVQLHGMLQ